MRLTDSRKETLDQVPGLIASALDTLREAGAVSDEWTPERAAQAIRLEPDLAATVAGASLVIEAITENPEAKRTLFAELDRLCAPETRIASNTSYLDVFPLIPDNRQKHALVMHWYTPPYIVDLVDVVPGPQTDPVVIEEARSSCWASVRCRSCSSASSRATSPTGSSRRSRPRSTILDEGVASAREIDDAIIHGLALRIPILGHLAKADFTGIELLRHALANASYSPPPARTRSDAVDDLVAQGAPA